ncbi:hypothetical protein CASFOL_016567 [Castilleja foliolosa]|uniref:Uncharacterized protein n=1 Tax=Castilleja foliolosa TaxID=1961234 RepID=A0ABD3D8M1_9LAMI
MMKSSAIMMMCFAILLALLSVSTANNRNFVRLSRFQGKAHVVRVDSKTVS